MFGKTKRNLSPGEKRFFCLGAFTVALLFDWIVPGFALARTWYIKADGTGDAPTIQAGVDSAAAGDTVMVEAGTFTDTTHVMVAGVLRAVNVHIQKQMTLIGDPAGDRPFIDGVYGYLGIFVENVSSRVWIAHLSLRGTAFSTLTDAERSVGNASVAREYSARIRCHSASVEVRDVVISHDHDGVFLSNSTAEVRDSELQAVSMAVLCYDGSEGKICNNTIFDCAIGVECDHSSAQVTGNTIGAPEPAVQGVGVTCSSSSTHVAGNVIRWCGTALTAFGSDVTIDGNKFLNQHENGMSLYNCSVAITNNCFYHGAYALWASSGSAGVVSNNTIDHYAAAGIFSELGSSLAIRNNIMTRVNWGVVCLGATATIECNDIFDIGSGAYDGCEGLPENGNFSADPQYCGVDDTGNYFLQSDSPCAPGNHPVGNECGLIGALPVNCGEVEVQRSTWGWIKSKFNDGGDQ